MENLPQELVYEILLRLPATILWNVARHVCQSWYSIISDSTFVRAHDSRCISDEEGKTLLFHRNWFNYKEGFFIYSSIGGVEPIGQKLQLPRDIDVRNTITLVCNGLVLYLYFKDGTVSLYLCNPILNQSITLPPMSETFRTFFYWTSGFGYDSTSNEYKVVHVFKNLRVSPKISHFYRCRINPSSEKRTNYCWEEVGSTDHDVCNRNHLSSFVNGKIHWLLSPYTSSSEVKILTFDLRTESLNLLRLRLSPEPGFPIRSFLLKNYNTEKLSLEVTYQNYSRTVWVMMEYGIENSLVEEYCESNITQKVRPQYFYSGHWKKDLRLFEKIYYGPRGYVVVGKSRENIVNSIDFCERNTRKRFLLSFVPSLLSLCNEEEKR